MNIEQLQNFAKHCKDMGVDIAGSDPKLISYLQNNFMTQAHPEPVVADNNNNDIASPQSAANIANDTNKLEGTTPLSQQFADGRYRVFGRVSETKSGEIEFKGVIKDVDLKSSGRVKYPCFVVKDTTKNSPAIHQDLRRRVSKLWNSGQRDRFFDMKKHGSGSDDSMRGTHDTLDPCGDIYIEWNSDNSIKDARVFHPSPDPIPNPKAKVVKLGKNVAAVAAPLSPTPASSLITASFVFNKKDPILAEDELLKLFQYSPDTSITSLKSDPFKQVIGRLGEIGVHKLYPRLGWYNEKVDKILPFDFESSSGLTLDIKTIGNIDHNLLIEKKKVDGDKMADIFVLCAVLEAADTVEVKIMGFVTKENVVKYITHKPGCLMMNSVYKIEKWYLVTEFDLI